MNIFHYLPKYIIYGIFIAVALKLYSLFTSAGTNLVEWWTNTPRPNAELAADGNKENVITQSNIFEIIKNESQANCRLKTPAHIAKANQLYEIMNHVNPPDWLGSPEIDQVMNIFQSCSAADLRQIYARFGLRTNSEFMLNKFTGDLVQWFEYEFKKPEQLARIKEYWRLTKIFS